MGRNQERDTSPRLPFVSTYHPLLPKIQNTIRRHWHLLQQYYPQVPEFCSPPLKCNKRAPNLRDSLVRADIGSNKKTYLQTTLHAQRSGTFPCLHCTHCSNVIKGDHILHPRTGQRIPIKGFHQMPLWTSLYWRNFSENEEPFVKPLIHHPLHENVVTSPTSFS